MDDGSFGGDKVELEKVLLLYDWRPPKCQLSKHGLVCKEICKTVKKLGRPVERWRCQSSLFLFVVWFFLDGA